MPFDCPVCCSATGSALARPAAPAPIAAATLLAALAGTAALMESSHFAGVARPVGVAVGGLLAWRRAPFVVVVVAAAGGRRPASAGRRALGLLAELDLRLRDPHAAEGQGPHHAVDLQAAHPHLALREAFPDQPLDLAGDQDAVEHHANRQQRPEDVAGELDRLDPDRGADQHDQRAAEEPGADRAAAVDDVADQAALGAAVADSR